MPSKSGLEHLQGADIHNLGNLFQCLNTFTVKNFFLIPSLNLHDVGMGFQWSSIKNSFILDHKYLVGEKINPQELFFKI